MKDTEVEAPLQTLLW